MSNEELEEFYQEIYERTYLKRIECLFEEPCPLYEEEDET
jgi:hypothetical protein